VKAVSADVRCAACADPQIPGSPVVYVNESYLRLTGTICVSAWIHTDTTAHLTAEVTKPQRHLTARRQQCVGGILH